MGKCINHGNNVYPLSTSHVRLHRGTGKLVVGCVIRHSESGIDTTTVRKGLAKACGPRPRMTDKLIDRHKYILHNRLGMSILTSTINPNIAKQKKNNYIRKTTISLNPYMPLPSPSESSHRLFSTSPSKSYPNRYFKKQFN